MLSTESLGKANDFKAVPGCGLICRVTNLEQLLSNKLSDVDIMNKRNSTSSFKVVVDGLARDEELISLEDLSMIFNKIGSFSKLNAYTDACILSTHIQ